MALPSDILQKMLSAAQGAVGSEWTDISAKLQTIAQNILNDAKQTAVDAASGAITQSEAKAQLDGIADEIDMAAYFADESLKITAQNAVNAAMDVLWSAVQASVSRI